jgi:hypothetical protein
MRSLHRRLARDRRRSFFSSSGMALWNHFRPRLEVLEDRRMLACEVFFREGALLVLGDDTDNVVEITAGVGGLRVTCDGTDEGTYTGVRAVRLELKGGSDHFKFDADESLGAGHVEDTDAAGVPQIVDADGGAGTDTFDILASPTAELRLEGAEDGDTFQLHFGRLSGAMFVAEGGTAGEDVLRLLGTQFAEKIGIAGGESELIVKWEGPDLNSAGGTDVAIESIEIAHEGIELGEVKGGDGDDQFHVAQGLVPVLHLFGQSGNDLFSYRPGSGFQKLHRLTRVHGGDGTDEVHVIGTDANESFDILGAPDAEVPDPLIRMTDLATGQVTADLSIVSAEAIVVDAAGGDDRVRCDENGPLANVNWTLITGAGNDKIDAILQSNPTNFRRRGARQRRCEHPFRRHSQPARTERAAASDRCEYGGGRERPPFGRVWFADESSRRFRGGRNHAVRDADGGASRHFHFGSGHDGAADPVSAGSAGDGPGGPGRPRRAYGRDNRGDRARCGQFFGRPADRFNCR